MKKIPFYRRIIFKFLFLVIIVLSMVFGISFMITAKNTEEREARALVENFATSQHITENFIELVGQVSQIWAKEIVLSHMPKATIKDKNLTKIDSLIETQKEIASADAIIFLNKDGIVISQAGSIHKNGDSLIHYDIVWQTLQAQEPITKIARENESFILYSSAVIESKNELMGILLVGYFINDIFLENVKKNINLEIALIGNSAIMSSTKWGGKENLNILPIAYLHYQNLLKNEKRFKKITYQGKSFIVAAKKLYGIESLETGSLLFGYPYDWVETEKNEVLKEQLLLFGIIFLISTLIVSFIVVNRLEALSKLSQATIRVSERFSCEKIEINTGDELELLADSFNEMTSELDILHRGMEQEIEHKTEALKRLNENLEERVAKEVIKNIDKEKQLVQQSRMALMGEMLSMIAHQWRQPLNAISATSASIELKAGLNRLDNASAIEKAQDISDFTQHLSETIDDFRNFFKSNKEKKETSYDEIIKSVMGIIKVSLINKNIQLSQDLNCHETFVTYSNEVKQVVLNLIKNAEDVLLEKEVEDPYIKIETYTKEGQYTLKVSDNAGGVPKEIIDNIFDPYFSTKKSKEGTGLGLYMSKMIIEEHCGGELSVQNDKDGAVFSVVLSSL